MKIIMNLELSKGYSAWKEVFLNNGDNRQRHDVKVLAYLIGEDKNQEKPKVVIRETQVDFKIPRERVITGDALESIDERGFYKE